MQIGGNRTGYCLGGIALATAAVAFLARFGVEGIGSPSVAVLVGSFLIAGGIGLLAAFDTPLTRSIGWRRLAGVGLFSVAFGLTVGAGNLLAVEGADPVFLAVVCCSIAAAGAASLDLVVFDGEHLDPTA